MSSQIGAAWPGSRSIDSHHVVRDSRGPGFRPVANQTPCWSHYLVPILAAEHFGPSIEEGSCNVAGLAATMPAGLHRWAPTERSGRGHHALILAETPAFKQTCRLSSQASPKGTGPHVRNHLPISASP